MLALKLHIVGPNSAEMSDSTHKVKEMYCEKVCKRALL